MGQGVHNTKNQRHVSFIDLAQTGAAGRWRYLISFPLIVALWLMFINLIPLIVGFAKNNFCGGECSIIAPTLLPENTGPGAFFYVGQYILMMLSIILLLPANLLIVSLVHRRPWRTLFIAGTKINWRGFRVSLCVSLLLLLAWVAMGLKGGEGQFNAHFDLKIWTIVVLLSCILIPLQILAEEVFFRGYLMQAVAQFTSLFLWRLLIPALVFGGLHVFNDGVIESGRWVMVYYLLMSLYLGLLVFWGNGLEYSAGFHLSTNIVALLVVTTPNFSLGISTLIEMPDSVWGVRELLFGLGYFSLHYAGVFGWMRLRHVVGPVGSNRLV